jgi:hypothetical protein
MVNVAMVLMFLTIMGGFHPFIGVAIMMLSMIFCIGITGAQMEYKLTQEGIVQELRPFSWSIIKLSASSRLFKWNEIKSYRSGNDLSRGMQGYHYLYISVSRFPYQLRLSDDQSSKDELTAFEKAFENIISTGIFNESTVASPPPGKAVTDGMAANDESRPSRSTVIGDDAQPGWPVKRKPDFYHSKMAHVIFWFFVVLFALIGYQLVATRNSNFANYWRMGIVVIPGMLYFAWRLYGRQRSG